MKDLFLTKSFWTGIAAIASGTALVITGDIPQGLTQILTGLAVIFLRSAIGKATQQ